jgi:hypothetical protein
MTDQRELDRLLGAFFVEGTNELADRVIDAALDEIDNTKQRRVTRMPRRFTTMTMPMRLAAAAVIGVLAVGGSIYLVGLRPPDVGPSPAASAIPSLGPSVIPTTVIASPRAAAWVPTGDMVAARGSHTSILLPNGKVLVAGGFVLVAGVPDSEGGRQLASAELYDPTSGSWTATGSMNHARAGGAAVPLENRKILVVGGVGPSAPWSAELYDPATGTWALTGSMTEAREGFTATLLLDGRVLVAGGSPRDESARRTAELYDPVTGTWSATGDLTRPRAGHKAVLLPDGKVLVMGGAGPRHALRSADLYDPVTGTWTATGPMLEARSAFAAALLGDGRVLVAGGNDVEFLATAEIYDPATGTWSATGDLTKAQSGATATLLLGGKVLLAGGGQGQPSRSAELYDPATGTWAPTASTTSTHWYSPMVLLPNGTVLAAGSVDLDADSFSMELRKAELYDPGDGG